jgi:hypothetical protein
LVKFKGGGPDWIIESRPLSGNITGHRARDTAEFSELRSGTDHTGHRHSRIVKCSAEALAFRPMLRHSTADTGHRHGCCVRWRDERRGCESGGNERERGRKGAGADEEVEGRCRWGEKRG